jgi:hypothetical protein
MNIIGHAIIGRIHIISEQNPQDNENLQEKRCELDENFKHQEI